MSSKREANDLGPGGTSQSKKSRKTVYVDAPLLGEMSAIEKFKGKGVTFRDVCGILDEMEKNSRERLRVGGTGATAGLSGADMKDEAELAREAASLTYEEEVQELVGEIGLLCQKQLIRLVQNPPMQPISPEEQQSHHGENRKAWLRISDQCSHPMMTLLCASVSAFTREIVSRFQDRFVVPPDELLIRRVGDLRMVVNEYWSREENKGGILQPNNTNPSPQAAEPLIQAQLHSSNLQNPDLDNNATIVNESPDDQIQCDSMGIPDYPLDDGSWLLRSPEQHQGLATTVQPPESLADTPNPRTDICRTLPTPTDHTLSTSTSQLTPTLTLTIPPTIPQSSHLPSPISPTELAPTPMQIKCDLARVWIEVAKELFHKDVRVRQLELMVKVEEKKGEVEELVCGGGDGELKVLNKALEELIQEEGKGFTGILDFGKSVDALSKENEDLKNQVSEKDGAISKLEAQLAGLRVKALERREKALSQENDDLKFEVLVRDLRIAQLEELLKERESGVERDAGGVVGRVIEGE
ncbi:hypothetical protein HK097_003735 [Rhizophlyctis rosea]|uniref:Uncharacterized protein n=1 Tax=Rhizophlyctis rosea TaxID=64517 RepID=A0AAD5X3S0_9FUNG|nr:hypothetical protein HK097_003735 [Rhizophlyctis rosea]